jgi:hypothetical protein
MRSLEQEGELEDIVTAPTKGDAEAVGWCALEHDPEGAYRFSLGTNAKRLPRRSCSNKKIERDDDSKKSHPALGSLAAIP